MCSRTYVFAVIPPEPVFCDGNGNHAPVALREFHLQPTVEAEKDAIDEALADVPSRERVPARDLLTALKSEEPIATRKLQERLDLSPFLFGAVVTSLINLGLLNIEEEGTSDEALRLTTRGKRLMAMVA
jgi:hypothetical protein